jgi:hypothetical protein
MKSQKETKNLFLLGLASVFLPYLPILFNSNQALLYRDLSQIFIPLKSIWLNSILELGRVTHWNPYALLGTPYLADSNPGPLYPLNWIFYIFRNLGVPRALVIFIFLHHVLIYSGGFFLFRHLRVRPLLAMLGAATIALGGSAMSSDNLAHMLGAELAVPFFLLFLFRSNRRPLLSLDLILASGMLALPVYAGDTQFTYVLALFSFGYLMRTRTLFNGLLRYATLGILAISAAAPQLLPTVAFIPETGRTLGAQQLPGILIWSMHPVRFLEMMFPLAFGDHPGGLRYWGYIFLNSFPSPYPFIFSLYVGALPFLFLATWLFTCFKKLKWRNRLHPEKLVGFLLLCFLVMGEFSPVPVYQWLTLYLPLWSSFRHPERLSYWPVLWVIISAFLAGERLLRLSSITNLPIYRKSSSALLLLNVAFAAFLFHYAAPLLPVFWAVLFMSSLALSLSMIHNPRRRKSATIAIVTLTLLDLSLFASRMIWSQPISITQEANNVAVKKIHADLLKRKGEIALGGAARFFASSSDDNGAPNNEDISVLDKNALFSWTLLETNLSSYFRIEDVRGFFGLMPRHPVDFWNSVKTKGAQRTLDILSVRYHLYLQGGQPIVTSSLSALPFLLLPEQVESLSESAAAARVLDLNWNFRSTVLLEGDVPHAQGAAGLWKIVSVKKNWDTMHLEMRALKEGSASWIVLQESFHRYWRANIDQQKLKLLRANNWAIGLQLPSPTHEGQIVAVSLGLVSRLVEILC